MAANRMPCSTTPPTECLTKEKPGDSACLQNRASDTARDHRRRQAIPRVSKIERRTPPEITAAARSCVRNMAIHAMSSNPAVSGQRVFWHVLARSGTFWHVFWIFFRTDSNTGWKNPASARQHVSADLRPRRLAAHVPLHAERAAGAAGAGPVYPELPPARRAAQALRGRARVSCARLAQPLLKRV